MNVKNLLIFLFFQTIYSSELKIGLCITATNKYIKFVNPLLNSARKYFFKDHNVKFLVFTDSIIECELDTKIIYLKHKPWPYSTMQRFEAYYNAKENLNEMDYVFACDADMLFVSKVSDEILSSRIATLHPLFYDDFNSGKKEYETNTKSLAYINPNNGINYFAGGFYGGTVKEFIEIIKRCSENIRKDLEKNFIAKWHDESHLNKYFADNPPTKILNPSYCYPQNYWKWIKNKSFEFKCILMALDKDYGIR